MRPFGRCFGATLAGKQIGGGLEASAAAQLASAVIQLEIEIPLLGPRFGAGGNRLLGGVAMIAPGEIGGALRAGLILARAFMRVAAQG
jgi:hypothetical protein